jgi:S1-C subfamily serine protease
MTTHRTAVPGRAYLDPARWRSQVAHALPALVALAALAWCAVAPGAALAHASTPADGRPPGGNVQNPAVRELDIAEPATVRIGTEAHATLALQLCHATVTLPVAGGSYLVAGTGSGAFVSANGDILTADHVVHVPSDEVAVFAAQDIADVLNHAGNYDTGCAASSMVTAADIVNGDFPINFSTHVLDTRTIVWQSTAFTGPPRSSAIQDVTSYPATVVTNSAYTELDIAIIHVNLRDTPSIALGNSAEVAIEDPLTVIGFPGNGDVNNNAINFLTPSVNNVNVSAVKVSDSGSQLLQVGGNVEHGDSGGPVLDAAGHVVGIVSFAGPDTPGVTSFLRTSNDALTLLKDKGISLAPGQFQTRWAHAFDQYASNARGHWHLAAQELDTLAQDYPEFKAVALYQNYAHAAAATEVLPAKPEPGPDQRVVLAAASGAVLLMLLLVIVLLVRRSRRQALSGQALARVAPDSMPGAPGGALPATSAPAGWQPAPYPGGWPGGAPAYPPSGPQGPNPGAYPPSGPQGAYPGAYPLAPATTEPTAPSGMPAASPPERPW